VTTSGTTTFTVTRDDIITDALATVGVIDAGESLTSADRTRGAFVLNLILKSLPIETWLLWCYQDIPITLISGTASYTIGPTGTIVANRPLRIAKAWRRDSNSNDTPMVQLARADYEMLTPKNTSGIPVNYYYDPQLNNGVLYTWPVIDQSGYTMYISAQRTIEDIASTSGSSTENFDLPQEWFMPLSWMLADQLSMKYTLNLQKVQMIKQEANMWMEKMANFSREEPGIYFTPNFQGQSN
jgi:hypothetical protein